MHPQILIELVDHESNPLTLLLNKTIDIGCIPQDWKIVYVSPIFNPFVPNAHFLYPRKVSRNRKVFLCF